MLAVHPVPESLRQRPFTLTEALAAGLTPKMLRGSRFRRLFAGVYVCADVAMDLAAWVFAARLVMPVDATLTHLSGLHARGAHVGPAWPLRFVTTEPHQIRRAGLCVSRASALPQRRSGVASVESCWLTACTDLDLVDAVMAADRLLHLGHTTLTALQSRTVAPRAPGVRPARRALALVRERVESPPETYVRLLMVLAGLPEPECNVRVGSRLAFIGRADLAYTAYRLLVEYDGRQHAETIEQWNRDLDRHDDLADATWSCIRVTGARLRHPRGLVHRVHRALVTGGYAGPPPRFGAEWVGLFETTSFARRSRVNDHRLAWA
jgi:hypothetical protein